MSNINNTSGVDLQSLGLQAPKADKKNDELNQEDFLKLLIAQISNADPLDPADPTSFVDQLASIGTVNGLDDLNNAFSSLSGQLQSSQALQASALVGKSVLVPSEGAVLTEGKPISGSIDVTTSTPNLTVKVYNAQGEVVKTISKGAQAAGDVAFEWDGLTDGGEQAPAGAYAFVAEGIQDGQNTQMNTYVSANVDSVTLQGENGLVLNLAGLGSVSFDLVKQISE